MKPKPYDATVARIAGNLLSGVEVERPHGAEGGGMKYFAVWVFKTIAAIGIAYGLMPREPTWQRFSLALGVYAALTVIQIVREDA